MISDSLLNSNGGKSSHMNKQQLNRVIDSVKEICARSSWRLTEKRRGVLELLLVSEVPLSAYEITDTYNQGTEKNDRSHDRVPNFGIYRSRKSGAQTGINQQ